MREDAAVSHRNACPFRALGLTLSHTSLSPIQGIRSVLPAKGARVHVPFALTLALMVVPPERQDPANGLLSAQSCPWPALEGTGGGRIVNKSGSPACKTNSVISCLPSLLGAYSPSPHFGFLCWRVEAIVTG